MSDRYAEIAFSPKVQAHQRLHGSHRAYRGRVEGPADGPEPIGPDERRFLAQRDSFYLASVGEAGWPYIQHRGGPRGFLRVLDEHTLGFADFRGNRQYISRGNLDHSERVALFLMDYAHRTRLKIFGAARAVEAAEDPELVARLTPDGYPARAERALLIRVEGYDWNCPQHIPQLVPADDVRHAIHELHEKIERLEKENAELAEQRAAGAAGDGG
ncbi:pyridoxamine 5'-phosphate oxidase family protein [Streptomyces sp. PR69]|uniref:pyridoxamine 5'-phosphate oxidase family protein n=1 Tax=Streptomyces sp. PR69 TaxID=2984950 RepID=UPI002265288B|nr:pyridoxamine 5'-phosphate oxidase family protein [Streptomyces sp. PR69]